MSPAEFRFFFDLIEQIAKYSYGRGFDDGKAGKPVSDQSLRLGPGDRLRIKTELNKSTQKR